MHTELRSKRKGGGIIIYVKNYLKFTPLIIKTTHFESLLGTLITSNKNTVTLCAFYRPPAYDITSFVSELSTILCKHTTHNTIILEDANIDLKKMIQQNIVTSTF